MDVRWWSNKVTTHIQACHGAQRASASRAASIPALPSQQCLQEIGAGVSWRYCLSQQRRTVNEIRNKCHPTNEANAEIRYLIFAERRGGRQSQPTNEANAEIRNLIFAERREGRQVSTDEWGERRDKVLNLCWAKRRKTKSTFFRKRQCNRLTVDSWQ